MSARLSGEIVSPVFAGLRAGPSTTLWDMPSRYLLLLPGLASFLTLSLASDANAQSNSFESGSLTIQSAPDSSLERAHRGRAVVPGYWDLGTSIRFSSPTTDSEDLDLPNITRIGVNGRLSLTRKLELSGGVALPPKRDTISDDPQLFDGVLMGRWAVSRSQSLYALSMAKRVMQLAGPTDDGLWGDAAVGWNGQSFMDEDQIIAFSWHLGGNGGRSFYTAETPWLVEAVAGLGLGGTFVDGIVGFTMGADFRFPILSGGRAYWAPDSPIINPQTRADLYMRMEFNLNTGWKVSGSLAFGDRGQVENPETILPLLEGGYDQTTFVLGFSYRGIRESKKKEYRDRILEFE